MKVFISWSGEKSHKVATALHAWLPYVIQAVKPIMSSSDISKGDRWSEKLARRLENTQFGIVVLTPSNLKAPWLNFEAGALSKFVDNSSLSPFLFQVRPENVEGPLTQFQITNFVEEDVFSLLASINNKLEPEARLNPALLKKTFETWWPDFKAAVEQASETHECTTGYEWLYYTNELSYIQQNNKCKSVWVLASEMRQAIRTVCEPTTVEMNIARGTKYRFIFPRPEPDDKIHTARDALWNVFERMSGKKEVWEIDPDEFRKLVPTYFLLLNPEEDSYPEYCLKVLLEIPVVRSGFWIEAEDQAARAFADRFDLMCKNSAFLKARIR